MSASAATNRVSSSRNLLLNLWQVGAAFRGGLTASFAEQTSLLPKIRHQCFVKLRRQQDVLLTTMLAFSIDNVSCQIRSSARPFRFLSQTPPVPTSAKPLN